MFQHWVSWGLERRYWIYWLAQVMVGMFFKIPHLIFVLSGGRLFFGIYVKGQEHLRRIPRGRLIKTPNHESFLDHFIILAAIPLRNHVLPVRTVTATWLFKEKSFLGTLIRAGLWFLGAYPAHKDGAESLAEQLDDPLHILKDDHVVAIYPEGGFSNDKEKLRSSHPGAAYLVCKTHAPVLPIAIRGAFRLTPDNIWKTLWEIIFGRRVVTVNFGAPIHITLKPHIANAVSLLDGIENDLSVFSEKPYSDENNNASLKTIYEKTHRARNKVLESTMHELWDTLHRLYHDPVDYPGTPRIDYQTCQCMNDTPRT